MIFAFVMEKCVHKTLLVGLEGAQRYYASLPVLVHIFPLQMQRSFMKIG